MSGGTDNHLMLVDLRNKGLTGKVAREGARRRGDHGEQEHRAEGDAVAVRDERHPHRHAGGDDARHEGGGDGAIADADRQSRHQLGDPAVALSVKEAVLDLTNRFPLYKSFPSMADKK